MMMMVYLNGQRASARRVARASHSVSVQSRTRCRSANARRHRLCRHRVAAELVSVLPPSPESGSRQTHATSGAPSVCIVHAAVTTTTTRLQPASATNNRHVDLSTSWLRALSKQ
ncbi:hypothetical protein ACI65C_010541 [Semiaphis heraclei]